MERCETPRLALHPGPTPGLHICPITVAIGRPAGGDAGIPDSAVLRALIPTAVLVEFRRAGHLLHHRGRVSGRRRRALRQHGVGEAILLGLAELQGGLVGAGEKSGLTGAQLLRGAGCGDGRGTLKNIDGGGVAGVAGNHVIFAILRNADRAARGGDGVLLPGLQIVDGIDHLALALRRREIIRIQPGHLQLGIRGQRDFAGVQRNGGLGAILRIERIAGGDRVVERCLGPAAGAGAVEGNAAVDCSDLADPGRRCCILREGGQGGECHRKRSCDGK